MNGSLPYAFLADGILVLHAAVVAFIVGGLVLIIVGNLRAWGWVNAPWFRIAHLAAISVVAAQSWLGVACPLTKLEKWLRAEGGATTYPGSFVGYWLERLLYYDAPDWVFMFAYSLFGLVVVAAWLRFPVRFDRRR